MEVAQRGVLRPGPHHRAQAAAWRDGLGEARRNITVALGPSGPGPTSSRSSPSFGVQRATHDAMEEKRRKAFRVEYRFPLPISAVENGSTRCWTQRYAFRSLTQGSAWSISTVY